MIRLEIPGGFYCDALPLPGGEFAAIYADDNNRVTTHLGDIPTEQGRKPGFVRVTDTPLFKFAGQANVGKMTIEWVEGAGWQPPQPEACGTSPVIYDTMGTLRISDCSIGVNGWRYVEANTGRLVTGDETISSRQAMPPFDGLAEWTALGLGLYVGQCNLTPGVGLWDGLNLRMVSPGRPRWIRAHRKGDNVSLAYVQEAGQPSVLIWLTVAELCASPVVMVDVPQPSFSFTHPVLVAPFKDPDGRTDAPLEVLVNQTVQMRNRPYIAAEDSLEGPVVGPCWGIYTESIDISIARSIAIMNEARVIYCHDAPTSPTIPTGLRPFDEIWIEYYRVPTETLEQSVARWRANTEALLDLWLGDCGVVPMFYCQGGIGDEELWPVSAVIEGLSALSALVNLSPRIKIIAPFAYQRANGIVAHPELQEAFARLLDAAYLAGRATLLPVTSAPGPTPSPDPVPIPQPVPPDLGDDMALPTVGTKGGYRVMGSNDAITLAEVAPHQDAGFVALKKTNGKYFRVNEKSGREEGESDAPGYCERITFDSHNIFLARPAISYEGGKPGDVVPYEWYSL